VRKGEDPHEMTERQARDSQLVQVRSGETPRSPVAKPPASIERSGVEAGWSNWPVRSIKRSLQRRNYLRATGSRGSRAPAGRAKATEGVLELGAGAEGPSGVGGVERPEGCRGNWRGPTRPTPAGGGASLAITGDGKGRVAERESEGAVVVTTGGTT